MDWSGGSPTSTSAEVGVRRKRLRDALADFDAATIATTHQFCQTVLRSLGVAGDTDSGAELVESLDDLVVEVVDDVYLAALRPRRRGAAVQAGRRARAGPGRRARPAGRCSPRPTPSRQRRARARAFAADGARRGRPAQASPGRPLLRRPADPAGRRPRDAGLPGLPADAPALADRARRRVPGHRPGAVEGARPRLLRPRHDGADRRPEAGDLRLPRRRHLHLPRAPPRPRRPGARWRSTGAATRRWSTRCRRCSVAPRSATRGSPYTPSRRSTPAAASRAPRSPSPCACACCAAPTSPRATRHRADRRRSARTSRRTSPTTWPACSPPVRHLRRAGPWAPATSRC